jgi:hypothetical protein
LQAQHNNIKKLSKHQINQSQIKVCLDCLVLQECKEGKNLHGGYLPEFAGSTQNPKKNIRTPNLPIRTKIFQKKYA